MSISKQYDQVGLRIKTTWLQICWSVASQAAVASTPDATTTLSDPLKIFEYNQQFEVELQVENEFSCKDTIIKTLEIPKFKPVFVPNVFSPNTDSKNDLFHPISACIKEIEFYIYDRWGKLVFYSEEIDKGWDGRFENADLKNGSYTWRLRYDHDGELIDENGFVILIR